MRIETYFHLLRTFENFKHLHVGMLSDIKRKTLPEIAKAVGLHDAQPLQNFFDRIALVSSFKRQKIRTDSKNVAGTFI